MKRAIALVLLAGLLVTCSAHAQSLALSWNAPTAYSDGAALPLTDIGYYTLSWRGATSEDWMPFDSEELPPTATSASIPVICGSYTVSLSVATGWNAHLPHASSYPVTLTYDTGLQCPPAASTVNLNVQ